MNKKQYSAFLKKHAKFKDMLMTWEQYSQRKTDLKREVRDFKLRKGLKG